MKIQVKRQRTLLINGSEDKHLKKETKISVTEVIREIIFDFFGFPEKGN